MFLLMKGLIIYMSYNDIIVFIFCCSLNVILLCIDIVVLLKARSNKYSEKYQHGFGTGLCIAGFIISIIFLGNVPNVIVKRQLIEVILYTFLPTYCYVFSLFICNNNKLTNFLFVLWSTIVICLIVGAVINLLLIWSHKPRLSASDWLVSLIVPLLCSSVSWIQGFKESIEFEGNSQRTLGDEIFNYVKSMNEKGYYPNLNEINDVFGKNVSSNVKGQVDNYNNGDIVRYSRDSGVHKKGEKKPALQKYKGGYKAHGDYIKEK